MSLKGKFKQPIYKEDLMPVLKQGIFVVIVASLLIGIGDLAISFSGWSLMPMFWIMFAIILGRRIRQSYFEYHIWYSVISILYFILGFYLINVVSNAGILFILNTVDLMTYVSVLNPLPYFGSLLPFYLIFTDDAMSILNWVIDILFFSISVYYAYKYSK